jgi:hypothetical protein
MSVSCQQSRSKANCRERTFSVAVSTRSTPTAIPSLTLGRQKCFHELGKLREMVFDLERQHMRDRYM